MHELPSDDDDAGDANRLLEIPPQLPRHLPIAVDDDRDGVALDADSQSVPFAVGDVDAERNRSPVIVRPSVVQEVDVASQRQSQLVFAAVAVDGEERGFGVTCG